MGVVQVAKISKLPKSLIPAFGLVIGMAVSVVHTGLTGGALLEGLILGLTSMGLYSGAKTTMGK